jgi:transposase-like protein
MGEVNIDEFFCPNEACPDYGKKGKGNIVLKEHYGKQNTALLRCKTCKKTFSENRDTPFFGLHTPKETVRSMAMLVEKGSIRGTARAMGADKDSVALWLKRAGEHCEEVTEYLLRDLNLRRDKSTALPIFSSDDWVLSVLKLGGNSINTSYIEWNNFTARNGVSRLIRKTIDFSKRLNPLVMHLCLFFAWFNLVKPHDALKIGIADGRRRWKQRTPAIAADLTDHVWTLEELFRFKPPP